MRAAEASACEKCGTPRARVPVVFHGVEVASGRRCDACMKPWWDEFYVLRGALVDMLAAGVSEAAATRSLIARIRGTAVAS